MLELSKLSQAAGRAVGFSTDGQEWSVWQDGYLARENRLEEFPGVMTAEERQYGREAIRC